MAKRFSLLLIIIIIFVVGCQGIDLSQVSDEDLERISEKAVICNDPYIRVGTSCCLDKNSNEVCDDDESQIIEEDNSCNTDSDCDQWWTCEMDKCERPTACPHYFNPVCGNDYVNYGNDCEAIKAGVISFSQGECPSVDSGSSSSNEVVDESIICPAYFNLVCGDDGVTYDNDCVAEKYGKNVDCNGACPCVEGSCNTDSDCDQWWTCEMDKCERPTACPHYFNPVCGNDYVNYGNDCEAIKAGVISFSQGECPSVDSGSSSSNEVVDESIICPAYFNLVCGDDGVTYDNDCVAEKYGKNVDCNGACPCVEEEGSTNDNNNNSDFNFWDDDEESTSKTEPDKEGDDSNEENEDSNSEIECPSEMKYVCGENKKTYLNECEAEKAKVRILCNGKCPCE